MGSKQKSNSKKKKKGKLIFVCLLACVFMPVHISCVVNVAVAVGVLPHPETETNVFGDTITCSVRIKAEFGRVLELDKEVAVAKQGKKFGKQSYSEWER